MQISMVVFFVSFGLIVLAHARGKYFVTNFFDNIIELLSTDHFWLRFRLGCFGTPVET
jgi:hypothetical protein